VLLTDTDLRISSFGEDAAGEIYVVDLNGQVYRIVETQVVRRSGSDRYATAAAASAGVFPASVPVAYVATGENYPDAVVAGAVAAAEGGPVLLVRRDTIPAATATELARLKPGKIVILGGTSVVSSTVASALAGYTSGNVVRRSGSDRYATAAAASAGVFPASVPVAYVATGENYPDAVVAGAVAAAEGGPVLLVRRDTIPAATATELARLKPGKIVILGGTSVVSSTVASALAGYTSGQ
jgi:putative cell wall-binding protein